MSGVKQKGMTPGEENESESSELQPFFAVLTWVYTPHFCPPLGKKRQRTKLVGGIMFKARGVPTAGAQFGWETATRLIVERVNWVGGGQWVL